MALYGTSRQQHSISAPKVEAAILFLDTGTQSLGLPLQNAHRLYSFTCLIWCYSFVDAVVEWNLWWCDEQFLPECRHEVGWSSGHTSRALQQQDSVPEGSGKSLVDSFSWLADIGLLVGWLTFFYSTGCTYWMRAMVIGRQSLYMSHVL